MEKETLKNLKNIVKNTPSSPGVYKMKNKEGEIIYIGKAKNLKKRVSSYLRKKPAGSAMTEKLLENTKDIEYIITDSELEAYILETNLIKERHPRYNIFMKDDKNFVYLKFQLDEDFPRILITRRVEHDNAKYIGPKTNTTQIHETFRVLKKILPFRHCNLNIKWIAEKTLKEAISDQHPEFVEVKNRIIDFPCLDYFIKRCPGPCVGAITPIAYKKIVQDIIDFLEGRGKKLIGKLKNEMMNAAANKKFEQAGRIRDKLFAVSKMLSRQKISDPKRKDTDVISYVYEPDKIFFALFKIREGKLIDTENFTLNGPENIDSEILGSFLIQYYEKSADIPKEILIPSLFDGMDLFNEWLLSAKKSKAKLLIPQRGQKNQLLELCRKNAEFFAKQCRIRWMAEELEKNALSELAKTLEFPAPKAGAPLKRIECYDISHISGESTVGSMIIFENGYPKKEHYRHFILRTIRDKPDDYASLEEVLARRLKVLAKDKTASFIIRKPSKKIFEQIKKIIKEARLENRDLEPKIFFCLFSQKELAGFARLKKVSNISAELGSLYIKPSYRGKRLGYFLMKKIIQKSPFKKTYAIIYPNLENYYAMFGFVQVKELPDAMKERINQAKTACRENPILMVMEKKKLSYEDPSFKEKPDLIIVDGGKGQLSCAMKALKKYKLDIPVIALAKQKEEIFAPKQKTAVLLEEGSSALKLLQRIRDEAHRFANTFQQDLHRKELIH